MTHAEMVARAGYYNGLAARHLGDHSYWHKWKGHHHEMTEADYWPMAQEIHDRLVQAGKLGPDEDPFPMAQFLARDSG